MSRHSKKPSLNSRDRNNPLVYWFEHEGEEKSVDLGALMKLAKQHACSKGFSHIAEDFSQWTVLNNLERINKGLTEFAHLNDCFWLWTEYIEKNFGAKSQKGPKWERTSKTDSYDKPIKDSEGGSFLDFIAANELNPEERLLLKEELTNRSDEEVEEALYNDRAARKTNDHLVYEYILRLSGNLGIMKYKPSHVAKDLELTTQEVSGTIHRLVRRGIIEKKNSIIHLKPDPNGRGYKKVA
jgi:hypothetical protein